MEQTRKRFGFSSEAENLSPDFCGSGERIGARAFRRMTANVLKRRVETQRQKSAREFVSIGNLY
jgi:hypothetical protein